MALHRAGWKIALRPSRGTWRPVRTKDSILFRGVYELGGEEGRNVMMIAWCFYIYPLSEQVCLSPNTS
jgi:hypothetical protein